MNPAARAPCPTHSPGSGTTRRLTEMALTLYRFMQSHPYPEAWLEEKVAMYFPGQGGTAGASPWEAVILEYAREGAAHCGGLLSRALEECREDPVVEKAFAGPLEQDRQAFASLEELAAAGDWDGLCQALGEFRLAPGRAPNGYGKDPLVARIKACRDMAGGTAGELAKYLAADRAACARETAKTAPLVKACSSWCWPFPSGTRRKSGRGTSWITAIWSIRPSACF